MMRVLKSGALGRSSVIRHPPSESSNDAQAPEDFKKVQRVYIHTYIGLTGSTIIFCFLILLLSLDPVRRPSVCEMSTMGDGEIDWQPTSASASGAICPGPRPPVAVYSKFLRFFIPRRSDLERFFHSEVA